MLSPDKVQEMLLHPQQGVLRLHQVCLVAYPSSPGGGLWGPTLDEKDETKGVLEWPF